MRILCSCCFEQFAAKDVWFRCMRATCPARERDLVLARYQQTAPIMMGHSFRYKPQPLQFNQVPTKATCAICEAITTRRICPHCHYDLPYDAGLIPQHVIALVGSSTAGKSHYIAMALHYFQTQLNRQFKFIGQFVGDSSITRWERDFYQPIFEERVRLPPTDSARRDRNVRTPIVYRLYRHQGQRTAALNCSFFDAAGEDFAALETLEGSVKQLLYAEGIIFLLDPLQMPDVRHQLEERGQTQFPREQKTARPAYLAARLHELLVRQQVIRHNEKIPIPTAFVFSKIDRLLPLLGADSLLRTTGRHFGQFNLDNIDAVHTELAARLALWDKSAAGVIPQLFCDYRLFGVSSLGQDPDANGKLESLTPLRVEDPFLWLLYRLGFISGQRREHHA